MNSLLLSRSANKLRSSVFKTASRRVVAAFSTQSGDDAVKPTALAKLHLEDGTTITGTSFGCHETVEGEVSNVKLRR